MKRILLVLAVALVMAAMLAAEAAPAFAVSPTPLPDNKGTRSVCPITSENPAQTQRGVHTGRDLPMCGF